MCATLIQNLLSLFPLSKSGVRFNKFFLQFFSWPSSLVGNMYSSFYCQLCSLFLLSPSMCRLFSKVLRFYSSILFSIPISMSNGLFFSIYEITQSGTTTSLRHPISRPKSLPRLPYQLWGEQEKPWFDFASMINDFNQLMSAAITLSFLPVYIPLFLHIELFMCSLYLLLR